MRVLVCGMPRSMTTWVFNVMRELVVSPKPRVMWIEPGADEESEFAASGGVVLAKCHHFNPVLAEAADIVVYSYRDLRTAAVSALRKFGATGSREQLAVWIEVERLWLPLADLVLRYEDVERDPSAAAAEVVALLRRHAGGDVGISAEPVADILRRVDASFERGGEATGPVHDPVTLVLPGHRTFQPAVEKLPRDEKALYLRVEHEFRDWLTDHGYLGDAAARPQAPADASLSGYVRALMRESASKEAAFAVIMGEVGEMRQTLDAQRKDLVAKQGVIDELVEAIEAYRAKFAVLGVVIIPANFVILAVRSVFRRTFGKLAPRLGVLHQHDPVPLQLPADYSSLPDPPPRISLVTPSYHQAAFIERTILSVTGQGYPNLEYFVQDGGSGDETVEVLRRHAARLTGWETQPDSGQAQAINRAFARTSGEIMGYLNSDDLLLPGAIAYVADFFARNPQVDVVYGHRILIDENDREIGRWMMPAHDDAVLSWADFVPQETLFWRRSIWDKAGGRMDESFRFALDWDLLLRFRAAGGRFERLPRFLGAFRVHPQQKTSAGISEIGFKEMDRIRERVLGRVPSRVDVRNAVAPYLFRHLAVDLGWRIRNRLGFSS